MKEKIKRRKGFIYTSILYGGLLILASAGLGLYLSQFKPQSANLYSVVSTTSTTKLTTTTTTRKIIITTTTTTRNIKMVESNDDESINSSLLTKIKCQEIGEKLYKDLVNKLGSLLVFNPTYTYNKRLNTCLYAGGFFGSNEADYMEMFVKDTISNEDILFYMARLENGEFVRIDILGSAQSIPDFNFKKDLLFNE